MELRDYIAAGEAKAGSLTALGKLLDMSQPTISGVKGHKRALTDKQLVQLANYINVSIDELIRANNLALGKNVEFWEQWGKVAAMACFALVTNFVTPSPAQAATLTQTEDNAICIMLNRLIQRLVKIKRQLFRPRPGLLKNLFEPLTPFFIAGGFQP